MSRTRLRQPWLAVTLAGILVALLCACAGSESTPEPTRESDSGAAAGHKQGDSATEPAEQPTLRTALERLRRADTGSFTQTSVIANVGTQTLSGVYEISSRRSRMTVVWDFADEDDLELRIIAIRDVIYMNSKGWPGAFKKCWLRADAAAIEEVTGAQRVAGTGGLPAPLVVLSDARAPNRTPIDSGLIIGTVDLVSAANLFGPIMVRYIKDPTRKARVPAEFILDDGELRSWRVPGEAVIDTLERERILRKMDNSTTYALSVMDVDVELDDAGDAVQVRPPPPTVHMSPAQMESGEGCAAPEII